MLARFRRWLSALPLDDDLQRRQGAMLQVLLLVLFTTSALGILSSFVLPQTDQGQLIALAAYGISIACNATALYLLRRGRLEPASWLACGGLVAAVGLALIAGGMQTADVTLMAFAIPLVLAGMLLGRRGLWVVALSCFALAVVATVREPVAPGGSIGGGKMPPAAVLGSFTIVILALTVFVDRFGSGLRGALEAARNRERELEGLRASLEAQVAERTHSLQRSVDELHASQATIRELSAPVIPVLPGVLVVPLVGALDTGRAAALADGVLAAVTQRRATQVIFDITGVTILDTQVAQSLLRTAQAVRLLGAEPCLVGIRAEVAQTIVTLGLDLRQLHTFASLQDAVGAMLGGAVPSS